MNRPKYPLEELREYIKNEALEKLIHLMKRTETKIIPFHHNENLYTHPGVNHLCLTLEKNIDTRNFVYNLDGTSTYEIVSSITFGAYVDGLQHSHDVLRFSINLKEMIEKLMEFESNLLKSIEDISSLNVGAMGKYLIIEKLNK